MVNVLENCQSSVPFEIPVIYPFQISSFFSQNMLNFWLRPLGVGEGHISRLHLLQSEVRGLLRAQDGTSDFPSSASSAVTETFGVFSGCWGRRDLECPHFLYPWKQPYSSSPPTPHSETSARSRYSSLSKDTVKVKDVYLASSSPQEWKGKRTVYVPSRPPEPPPCFESLFYFLLLKASGPVQPLPSPSLPYSYFLTQPYTWETHLRN